MRMGSENGERVSIKHFRFHQGSQGENPSQKQKSTQAQMHSQAQPQIQPQAQKSQAQKAQEQKSQKTTKITKEGKKHQATQSTKQTQPQRQTRRTQQRPAIPQRQASKPQRQSLESALRQPSSPSIYDYGEVSPTQEIRELYGQEFGSLNLNQQRFIKSNLDKIGKITHSYLRYPRIAGKIGQQGDNVVEFYLHPNRDISQLRLLTSSGYTLLDDNSIHTIKIAYKDYPYPTEKTKIRIRVMYRIY